jgi:hypothetical protein
MNDDLSEEAFDKWWQGPPRMMSVDEAATAYEGWQECRRRAEARIEALEQEIEDLVIGIKEQGMNE